MVAEVTMLDTRALTQGPAAPTQEPVKQEAPKKKKKKPKKPKKKDRQQQDGDGDPDGVPAAPARKVAPLQSFLPSKTRRELHQWQPAQPRRRRGCGGVLIDVNRCDGVTQARRLQGPLLWRPRPLTSSVTKLYSILDSTPHRGTAWHALVEQIQVAYDFAELRMMWKSRELLEDAYATLQNKRIRTGVMRKYHAGVKHVLDATWLLLRDDADARADRPLPDGTLLADVVLFEELDDQQRACVFAIKAVMSQDVEAADKALELDPTEGQWHYVKWQCLRDARKQGKQGKLKGTAAEEHALLLKAYRMRKTPAATLDLARAALDAKDVEQCVALLSEAAELFPTSAFAHFHSAELYKLLKRDNKKDAQKVAYCSRMAIRLAQGTWLRASKEWGVYCIDNQMMKEGLYHLTKAEGC